MVEAAGAPGAPGAFDGFVDDASSLATDGPGLHEVTAAYAARPAADAAYVGRLVLADTSLPLVRGVAAPLHVVLGGGAGQVAGPTALAHRLGLRLEAVETTLRDPADPAGNARRVVAAVQAAHASGGLDEETEVHVALSPGPLGAAGLDTLDVVADAGLRLVLPAGHYLGTSAVDLLAWIDAALDREVTFRCGGLTGAWSQEPGERGFLNVLVATGLLFDAVPGAAEALDADRRTLAELRADVEPARARRWFTGFASTDPEQSVADLRAWESGA